MSRAGKVLLLLLACVVCTCCGHNEIVDLLIKQEAPSLSKTEVDALLPFFEELQVQYDFITNLKLHEPELIDETYVAVFEEFRNEFASYMKYEPSIVYDTELPTLEHLIGIHAVNGSKQEQLEFEDLQSIMQDVIDDAEAGIAQLVQRALDIERNLLKLNKPKIIMAAINGLNSMWNIWGHAIQTAYCSYSHVPQLKQDLHTINGGVECYTYSMSLILRVQHETVEAVKNIRKNVSDLVTVYKKIAAKKTITGKILSGTLNLFKTLRRLHDIIAICLDGYDKINNELTGAALKSAQCGEEFVSSVPHIIETVQNLTGCIRFVDHEKSDYEFMKPEEDRYWNIGELPPEIPHENDVDEDMETDDENDEDDYIDHR
ncbi:uncharacterized protein LOC115625494 [Scaptodrosophila lebanonensis]|uniref:Uncharacterized protein LOC115625494 n=1 Tax=Drosophila lebanonensis TaxID=7225 RepID=A0A6J2TK73_DROLE|nr:uncharacterized protein LOC115625494 [Scaptodrosophila lebanonensis]